MHNLTEESKHWLLNDGPDWIVVEHDGTRLFCNGHVIMTTDLEISEPDEDNHCATMRRGAPAKWKELLAISPLPPELKRGGLGGTIGLFWRQFEVASTKKALNHCYINERYVRLFKEDARFHGDSATGPVLAFEDGVLAGIVMPLRSDGDMYIWGRTVPDSIIYHVCDEDGDDEYGDEEDEDDE